MVDPRSYQEKAVVMTRKAIVSGFRRIIQQLSCGAGKTVIAAEITRLARLKDKKVLFLVNRKELVYQAKIKMEDAGLECGVIMAGEPYNLGADIQVASMQTYIRRMDLEELKFNKWWHDADIIFVDECHSAVSPSYQKILKAYGNKAITIGLTATSCRSDGRGLGEYFDKIIQPVSMGELIKLGYLLPFRYYAPYTPDLSGIPTVAGDYSIGVLGQRLNQKKLIGDIYDNWSQICPERSTIVFATNIAHSIALEQLFLSKGVSAKHIDHKTPKEERAAVIEDFKAGRLQVIMNQGILCEGTDLPIASCIILGRSTKSLGRYIQMGGRGSRIYGGQRDCIILDHAGCINEHGFLESDREWTLDGKKKAWGEVIVKEKEVQMVICSACGAVLDGVKVCPECGSMVKRYGRQVETEEGTLREVGKKEPTMADKRQFYGMCLKYCTDKGYKSGAVAHKYKEKFGVWPRCMNDVLPIPADLAFENWVKYCNIKRAKIKEKYA